LKRRGDVIKLFATDILKTKNPLTNKAIILAVQTYKGVMTNSTLSF